MRACLPEAFHMAGNVVHVRAFEGKEQELRFHLGNLARFVQGIPPTEFINFSAGEDGRLLVDVSESDDIQDLMEAVRPGTDWLPLPSSASVIMPGNKQTCQDLHCDLDRELFCEGWDLHTQIFPMSACMGYDFCETSFRYGIGDEFGDTYLQPYQYAWFSSFDCWHKGLASPTHRLHLVWAKMT